VGSIVAKHNLQPYAYSDIVSWGFADAIFGSDWDIARSTLKARRYASPHSSRQIACSRSCSVTSSAPHHPEHSHCSSRHFDSTASVPPNNRARKTIMTDSNTKIPLPRTTVRIRRSVGGIGRVVLRARRARPTRWSSWDTEWVQ